MEKALERILLCVLAVPSSFGNLTHFAVSSCPELADDTWPLNCLERQRGKREESSYMTPACSKHREVESRWSTDTKR